MQQFLKQALSPRYLGLAGLCILAWIYMALFRYDNFGIEEDAARALLLNWSIIHQIASPIALYGAPDLRAILFIILDLHWAGNLVAAKVFSMLTLFGTGLLLYRWSEKKFGDEAAMISTVLLLISPIALMQADAIGSGIYMLWGFVLVHLLAEAYRSSESTISGWFFLLILMTAFTVSMHPMGFAVPIVLAWLWRRELLSAGKGRNLLIGVILATALMVMLRWGWNGMEAAASNPLALFENVLLGPNLIHSAGHWGIGLILITLLAIVFALQIWNKTADPMTLLLIVASVIGLLHADPAWAMIAYASLLYLGIPQLIRFNRRYGWQGMVGQRGMVLIGVMVLATVSMTTLRDYRQINIHQLKNDTDTVIAVLAQEAQDTKVPFIAASQWPARTLLATRRDVLPLPPAAKDVETFQKKIHGLTHLAFDPQKPELHELALNAAALSHQLETIALLPGGVVLKVRQPAAETSKQH